LEAHGPIHTWGNTEFRSPHTAGQVTQIRNTEFVSPHTAGQNTKGMKSFLVRVQWAKLYK
jgi:hypothetical protein